MNARAGSFGDLGGIGRIIREFTPVRAIIVPPVTGQSSCKQKDTCETHDLDLFCRHDTMVNAIVTSGLLVFVAALAAFVVGLASWSLAKHFPGAFYLLAAFVAIVLTNVVFWRVPAQRRAGTLQVTAAFTAVGVGARFGPGTASIGVAAGLAVLSIASLVLGAVVQDGYGLRNVVRLAIGGAALILFAVGLATELTGASHAGLFFFSSLGAAFSFAAGFVPEAIPRAMQRSFNWVSPFPREHRWHARPITKSARRLPGAFVIVSIIADQLIAALNALVRSAVFATNAAYSAFRFSVREAMTRLVHFFWRVKETLRETWIGLAGWWADTAEMLDHKLLPSTLPVAVFGAAAGMSYGAAHLTSAYVGSGDGFAGTAWVRLAAISGLGLGITIAFTAGWSSFGEPFPESISSVSRSAMHLVGAGMMIVAAYALATDFGIPVTHRLPVVGGFASGSPYEFGPVAALTLVGLLCLVIWLILTSNEPANAGGSNQGGLKEWLERLKRFVVALEVERIAVPLFAAVAVVASLVVGTASFIDGR